MKLNVNQPIKIGLAQHKHLHCIKKSRLVPTKGKAVLLSCLKKKHVKGGSYTMTKFLLFFLFFGLSIAFAFLIDLLMGVKASMAMSNYKRTFSFMTLPEYLISFAFLLTMIIPHILSFFKKKRDTRKA